MPFEGPDRDTGSTAEPGDIGTEESSDVSDGFWLPEEVDSETGDGRPFRPDLPWFRNLRWVKIHAMQLGFAVGLIIYWGQSLNFDGVVFSFAVTVAMVAFGLRQVNSFSSSCRHGLGVHDLQEKPWYGLSVAVATWATLAVVVGVPV